MTRLNDQQTQALLKQHMKPMAQAEPSRDLWPRMLRRLDEKPRPFSNFDLVLFALVVLVIILWPKSIAGFFYQL